MNKKERVDAVLAHQSADRAPVSLWYHFGIQHINGEQFAKVTLDYFNYYDFDFLKVMNDYFYPVPEGLDAVATSQDLEKLTKFSVADSPAWQEQFKAIKHISSELKDKAYFIDTVFDPWQSINRNLAAENMKQLMAEYPDYLLDALDRVSDNLIDYCKIVLKLGASGIFISIPAGSEIVSRNEFHTFVKPFTLKILNAINPLAKMNTLHVHGKDLFFEDVLDLPVQIFNWWDRGPSGPSLQWVKKRVSGCVMGGIDQTIVARRTRAFLKNHVEEGMEMGGDRRFFLANGCTIDSWVYPGALETIVASAQKGRNKQQ